MAHQGIFPGALNKHCPHPSEIRRGRWPCGREPPVKRPTPLPENIPICCCVFWDLSSRARSSATDRNPSWKRRSRCRPTIFSCVAHLHREQCYLISTLQTKPLGACRNRSSRNQFPADASCQECEHTQNFPASSPSALKSLLHLTHLSMTLSVALVLRLCRYLRIYIYI